MKKRLSLLLAVVMLASCFSMTAFATEDTDTYEYEITSDSIAVPFALEVDQTFTMGTSHRGADRTYSGSELSYAVTITDANGNAVSDTVAVELYDYNHGTSIHSNVVTANGGMSYYTLPITSGRVYYFRYTRVTGSTSSFRVHMRIYSN